MHRNTHSLFWPRPPLHSSCVLFLTNTKEKKRKSTLDNEAASFFSKLTNREYVCAEMDVCVEMYVCAEMYACVEMYVCSEKVDNVDEEVASSSKVYIFSFSFFFIFLGDSIDFGVTSVNMHIHMKESLYDIMFLFHHPRLCIQIIFFFCLPYLGD